MRLREVGDSHHELLRQLARRISRRLDAAFIDLPGTEKPTIGIQLREGSRHALMELPEGLLLRAQGDVSIKETIRVRIKARRDRMLFRGDPAFLSRQGAEGQYPPSARSNSGGRYQRGRR